MIAQIFVNIFIVIYYIIAIAYVAFRKKDIVSPAVIFVILQILMLTGILSYVDFSSEVDRKLIYFYLIALIFFIIGTLVRMRRPVDICHEIDDREWDSYQVFVIVFLVVLLLGTKYDFYFGVHNLKNRDSMFEKMLLERLKYIKNSDAEKFNDKIKEEIKIINDYFKKTI